MSSRLVYRIVHKENLRTLIRRGGIHAPACCPADGLPYRAIHDESIRLRRGGVSIRCGPRGSVGDYVSFYLGPRSPMLYRIWKGNVACPGGQEAVVYVVSTVEMLQQLGLPFVFSDGHSLSILTTWSDDPAQLDHLDWKAIEARQWNDTDDDPDRCRRKQAELLVHRFVPWSAVAGIAALNDTVCGEVRVLFGEEHTPVPYLRTRPDWYY